MTGDMKWTPSSWNRVAEAFSEAATGVADAVSGVVAATTNPAACNAASGLATVDGAVSVMLSVFGEIMQTQVVTGLRNGLAAESAAMIATAHAYTQVESQATDDAARAADGGSSW